MQICLSSMFTYVFVHIIRHTIFKIVHALEQSFASVSQQRNSQKTLILYFAPKHKVITSFVQNEETYVYA